MIYETADIKSNEDVILAVTNAILAIAKRSPNSKKSGLFETSFDWGPHFIVLKFSRHTSCHHIKLLIIRIF